jgi:protein-disulfide isomerase
LAYLWVMAGVIHSYCLFCLLTDAINVLAFATVLSLKPEGFSQHKPDLAKWKPLLGITVTSVLLLALGLKTLDASVVPNSSTDELAKTALGSPVLSVNAGPEFPSIGRADAPVTVVEFSDFQCPYCRIGAFTLNSVLAQHPNDVRLVFRNFPLDSGCNRKMDRPMHPYACDAAKHVICANKQGKFQAVYETLFENQATFAPGRIEALSQEAGTDGQQMSACLIAPETNLAISRDVEEAATLGIESTPTFFVNGHKIEGVQPPAVWDKMIGRLVQGTK